MASKSPIRAANLERFSDGLKVSDNDIFQGNQGGEMAEAARSKSLSRESVEAIVRKFSADFERARTRRVGSILLRLSGENGGDFYLHSTDAGCSVSYEATATPPQVEVIGNADRICAILQKDKDGRLQFYAGGMRVRGDLEYLSERAHEMGHIRESFYVESR
jgi:hypothetical protein